MSASSQETVTRLLLAVREGDRGALNELFPLVYQELHKLARLKRRGWHGDHTLNTTALVHEAYVKLADQEKLDLSNRTHFFAVAARAMRHILINYAEARRAQKRGGDVEKVSLEEELVGLPGGEGMTDEQADKLVALGEALKKFETRYERQAQVVDCKFFGGMTNEETAEALGISAATVKRDWTMAQAWLLSETQHELTRWAGDAEA